MGRFLLRQREHYQTDLVPVPVLFRGISYEHPLVFSDTRNTNLRSAAAMSSDKPAPNPAIGLGASNKTVGRTFLSASGRQECLPHRGYVRAPLDAAAREREGPRPQCEFGQSPVGVHGRDGRATGGPPRLPGAHHRYHMVNILSVSAMGLGAGDARCDAARGIRRATGQGSIAGSGPAESSLLC